METPSNTYLLSFIVHNCADLPPEYSSQDGTWTGYRLDGDKTHTESTLKRYGRHKAWIDSSYKFEGKNVILVYNAARKTRLGIFSRSIRIPRLLAIKHAGMKRPGSNPTWS